MEDKNLVSSLNDRLNALNTSDSRVDTDRLVLGLDFGTTYSGYGQSSLIQDCA